MACCRRVCSRESAIMPQPGRSKYPLRILHLSSKACGRATAWFLCWPRILVPGMRFVFICSYSPDFEAAIARPWPRLGHLDRTDIKQQGALGSLFKGDDDHSFRDFDSGCGIDEPSEHRTRSCILLAVAQFVTILPKKRPTWYYA